MPPTAKKKSLGLRPKPPIPNNQINSIPETTDRKASSLKVAETEGIAIVADQEAAPRVAGIEL